MDWITGLQSAIDYMEEHLTEEVDYTEAARRACCSSFHFQRIFGILCGVTIGEYIRCRRMTLAGSELALTDRKVIDVALKYGYESPESFSRAFTKFHHVPPSQARHNSASLKSFSRLSVKLILEGGTTMDYRIEELKEIPVVVKKVHFVKKEGVISDQVGDLWIKSNQDGTIPAICSCAKHGGVLEDSMLGICFNDPDAGDYDYGIGAVYDGTSEIPEGLSLETLPASTWVAFPGKGKMPEGFQELWKKIYTEFFPASPYQPAKGMCLEVYSGEEVSKEDYGFEVWVSVEKKK